MTDVKETQGKKKLSLSRPGKLELNKTIASGSVRQTFPHGRSKKVEVEIKKKRTFAPGAGGDMTEVTAGGDAAEAAFSAFAEQALEAEASPSLTDAERTARVNALKGAFEADEQAREMLEFEEQRRADEEVKRQEEEERLKREEEERRQREEEERRKAQDAEARKPMADEAARPVPDRAAAAEAPTTEERRGDGGRGKGRPGRVEPRRTLAPARRGEQRRRGGKLTVTQALSQQEERMRSLASLKRARERERQRLEGPIEAQKVIRDVVVPETITVQELANRMATRASEVIKALMRMDVMATINQTVDADTAELLVTEFGHRIRRVADSDVEIGLEGGPDEEGSMVARAPVVTVMGHVDHGKTSLLDALRETDVAAREAGGITQHIGAYQVELASGQKITFLDTPGHEAFTAMRARGAKVTDIVVLVVAADDGIMPQSVEAINHARAAKVPMIVAINKMDRPDADPNKVRQGLLQHEIVVEEMGGDVLDIEVSAVKKTGLDKLEEAILLQSELMELTANPDREAQGVVVEAKLDRGRGVVATVLVQRGELKVGDIIIAGGEWGKVRALVDDRGDNLDMAGPSMPVEVLGLGGMPAAGDDFAVVETEARAREVTEFRQRKERDDRAAAGARGTVEQMFSKIAAGESQEVPLILKADVQGSVEAISAALEKLGTDEVEALIMHAGVGGITESDLTLAEASSALVIGFNVRANRQAREMAQQNNIDINYYSVIYELVDDVKAMMSGMLAPTQKERILGNAEIREVFSISKSGKVAGCYVTDGLVRRGARVRLVRDDVVIHEGSLSSLRRFKDEVKEVKESYECGMAFETYQDIQVGDTIECFEIDEIAREL